MWLEDEAFKQVIASTPLISIDLIVRDTEHRVLLGERLNRPAQGYWFVPGGRIQKDETISVAFARLVSEELGISKAIDEATFFGVYQHLYQDNVFDEVGSTHYIVLAFELILSSLDELSLPDIQHGKFDWFSEADLLVDKSVHGNTKDYFRSAVAYGAK